MWESRDRSPGGACLQSPAGDPPHHRGLPRSGASVLASPCLSFQSRAVGTIRRGLKVAGTVPGTEQLQPAAQRSFSLSFSLGSRGGQARGLGEAEAARRGSATSR